MDKRVVITGMGVISPVGNDVDTFWSNLCNGVSGIDYITAFPTEQLPVKIAGIVKDFNPEEYGMDKPFVRKQDTFTLYGVAAAYQAVRQSGICSQGEGQNIDPFRLGVYVGSGIGGFATQYREISKMIEDPSGQWISPLFIPTMISNIAAGHIAIKNQAKGPCLDIVTACATSTNAMGEAYRAIKHGYADAIITGGCESSTIPIGIAGFARGARILGEMVGYGNTCDAYHSTAPRPDGSTQAECIRLAIKEAGFDASKDNVYINAHGTGTKLNDAAETLAYKLAFGDFAYKAHISSIKSMTGHMFGAAGAAEAIATILALRDDICPPTIHLDTPDPECDLDYTPNTAVRTELTLGISDSFGFGGHNACVAFRKCKD